MLLKNSKGIPMICYVSGHNLDAIDLIELIRNKFRYNFN